MSKSHRGSHHIQPGRVASSHITSAPETESAAAIADEEPQLTQFETKANWVSILIWLTIFLGLSLTIWLDLIIGLFHKPGGGTSH